MVEGKDSNDVEQIAEPVDSPPPVSSQERFKKSTLGCLCLLSMIKGADMQLLPASFRAMEIDLHIEPFSLALMALCQGVSAACTGPVWGNLVDSGLPRRRLLMCGSFCWGLCTISLAFASSLSVMATLRVLNGASLAMLLPVVQSFVVDLTRKEDRGCTFGLLYFSTNLGQVLACLFVTPISTSQVLGHDGWRVALVAVGFLSLLVVGLVPLLISEEPIQWRPERLGPAREVRKLIKFIKIPTFCVIILQGVFGTIPGAAFSFVTMYLQYLGISDFTVALVISLHVVGDAIGGLMGGLIGDAAAEWSPRYGRALTAMVSVLGSLPTVAATFLFIPQESSMIGSLAGILFLHGLIGSWVAPGCICPIMCEIVPRASLGSAYAWELAIVFCSGNILGPMLVGIMSERLYGYKLSTDPVSTMSNEDRMQNARALGKSLFYTSAIPYVCCAAIFVMLFFTHHKDARRNALHDDSDSETPTETNTPGERSRLLDGKASLSSRKGSCKSLQSD